MASSRFAFNVLLEKVNPDRERLETAQRLPRKVRDWLKAHEFETRAPHSLLIGSYGRLTAHGDIKDVDSLLFLPHEALERTPESVIRELKSVLDDYPDATAEASPQRRSVRLDFRDDSFCMDIVGAVADRGQEKPLWIPDRQKKKWVPSDPLGYGHTLSKKNGEHGEKLVPLIKIVKGWRDVQMAIGRPKSYVLEVIVFHAVTSGGVIQERQSLAKTVCTFFEHIEEKWRALAEDGNSVPRVLDPQLGHVISAGWERSHFESFMRRVGESARASRTAVNAESDETADPYWRKVFGSLWPTAEEIRKEARAFAAAATPGKAYVSPLGGVSAVSTVGAMRSRPTTFDGTEA